MHEKIRRESDHHIQSPLLPLLLGEGAQKRSEVRQDHSQTLGYREQNQTTQRLGERKLVWSGRKDLQDPARKFGLRSVLCTE